MNNYGYYLSEVMQTNRFEDHCAEVYAFAESLSEEDAIGMLNTLSDDELLTMRALAEDIPAYAFLWEQLGKLGGGLFRKASAGWGKASGQGFMKQLGGAWQGAKDWGGAWNKALGTSIRNSGRKGQPGSFTQGFRNLWDKMGNNNPTLMAKKNIAAAARPQMAAMKHNIASSPGMTPENYGAAFRTAATSPGANTGIPGGLPNYRSGLHSRFKKSRPQTFRAQQQP